MQKKLVTKPILWASFSSQNRQGDKFLPTRGQVLGGSDLRRACRSPGNG